VSNLAPEDAISLARAHCSRTGVRLTCKRERVLELLLRSDTPLSAYQIADLYRARHKVGISIMSIYRMLGFLTEANLAHRLETTNQYLPCSHIESTSLQHADHRTPQFLICDLCHRVDETGLHEKVLSQLQQDLSLCGFTMQQHQLEIHGTCSACAGEQSNNT
jgi:Fur family transcriptional regulator, zinc uptake regulator